MALANHAALLGTIGDDVELLALAVLDDLADNGSAFNNGSANLNSALLANGQDFFEGDFAVSLSVQLLNKMLSPTLTLYCLPPVRITAYM